MVYQSVVMDVSRGIGEKRKMEMAQEVTRFKARKLIKEHAVLEGDFSLASDRQSSYYVKLMNVLNNPLGLFYILDLLENEILGAHPVQGIGGIALGGAPLVYGFISRWPGYYAFLIRTDEKTHGVKEQIEVPPYVSKPRGTAILLDDVLTTGGSLLNGYDVCKKHGIDVVKAVVVVDRQEGGIENCAAQGLKVTSIFKIDEIKKE